MRRSAYVLTLAVVLVCVVPPGNARAFHGSTLPVLSRTEFTGSSWSAYRLSVPSSSVVEYEVEIATSADDVYSGLLVSGPHSFSTLYVFTCPRDVELQATVEDPALSVEQGSGCNYGGGSWYVRFNNPFPGPYTAAVITSSGAPVSGVVTLRSSGASLRGATSGDDVFAAHNGDFGGSINARVAAGLEAQVIRGGSAVTTIENRLWGWFVNISSVRLDEESGPLTYEGPISSDAPGHEFRFRGAGGPGVYTFRVDEKTDAGALNCCRVNLIAADVVVPPL